MTSSSSPPSSPPEPASTPPSNTNPLLTARTGKQLSLFFAGATFFALSSLVTRRSLHRRRLATAPAFYQPSNQPPKNPINGTLEAFEALNIATVNVASFAMMATGGLLWAFDIAGLKELRVRVRAALGVEGDGHGDVRGEEALEEWLASFLERRRGSGEGGKEGGVGDRDGDQNGEDQGEGKKSKEGDHS